MSKIIKVILLANNQTLISEIEEVGADIGEPDCRLIRPFEVAEYENKYTLSPFLLSSKTSLSALPLFVHLALVVWISNTGAESPLTIK